MDGRFTLTNLAIEMGAKAGLIGTDAVTETWLNGRLKRAWSHLTADLDALYSQVVDIDAAALTPRILKGKHIAPGVRLIVTPGREGFPCNLTQTAKNPTSAFRRTRQTLPRPPERPDVPGTVPTLPRCGPLRPADHAG